MSADKKTKVFIDGSAGTTGLRIAERLSGRDDITMITLPEEARKLASERKRALESADVAILCLPDDAAREAVALCESPDTVIIDASTAHRTSPEFVYGFPELGEEYFEKIQTMKRIAVPGCHACGFIALIKPLVDAGILSRDEHLSVFSLTGYSGGGKKMIAEYESSPSPLLRAPRVYGISQEHKHLREMTAITGISAPPVFCPTVCDFYSGMEVTVPLFSSSLGASASDIAKLYAEKYSSRIVFYSDESEGGFLSAAAYSGRDCMEISVHGNGERITLTARYDNLGKGASGAAVECLNISLGLPPETGLLL